MAVIGNLGPGFSVDLNAIRPKTAELRKQLARAEAMFFQLLLSPADLLEESKLMISTNRAERRAMRKRAKQ